MKKDTVSNLIALIEKEFEELRKLWFYEDLKEIHFQNSLIKIKKSVRGACRRIKNKKEKGGQNVNQN